MLSLPATLAKLEPTEAMIVAVDRVLKEWKRRKKSKANRAKAKRQHQDPAFRAKFTEGTKRHHADPLLNAWRKEKIRRTHKAKAGAFPPEFPGALRSKYYRMRRCGVSREDAIAALLAKPLSPSMDASPPRSSVPLSPRERARSPIPSPVTARISLEKTT